MKLRAQGLRRAGARAAFGAYKSVVSPALHLLSPSRCLYLPTCSEYAYIAVDRFGVVRGSYLALRRLLRCHPLAKGGLDPVPDPPCIYHGNAGEPRPSRGFPDR